MNINASCDTMVTIKEGAVVCPQCRRKIRGLRLYPESTARRINLQCQSCGCNFDIDIPSGQRSSSPRH